MAETILDGGTSEVEDLYVGPVGELRVDTDNDELRLHDNSKLGGFRIINRDQMDSRYQARSIELDGFDFPTQGKGIVVRVAPAVYALRGIVVDTEQLTITNPFGTNSNFILAWAGTITSDHTFSGVITFDEQIQADGGVLGNVIGNVTGNLVGNVTGNLTGNAVGDHSGSFTGDLDVTGATIQFDNNQIERAWVNGLDDLLTGLIIPTGIITLWSGSVGTIPSGWALCDGANGTPNLRNLFVIGAGDTYAVGASGGTAAHTHTASSSSVADHDHGVTIDPTTLTLAQIPSHEHGCGLGDRVGDNYILRGTQAATATTSVDGRSDNSNCEPLTESVGGGGSHTHTSSSANAGSHNHAITVDAAANGLPPYYALAYIMKTA